MRNIAVLGIVAIVCPLSGCKSQTEDEAAIQFFRDNEPAFRKEADRISLDKKSSTQDWIEVPPDLKKAKIQHVMIFSNGIKFELPSGNLDSNFCYFCYRPQLGEKANRVEFMDGRIFKTVWIDYEWAYVIWD